MEAAVVSSPSLPVGTRFGDFVAVRPLAAGGMAELYLAARRRPDAAPEMVAIKRLLPHLGWDPEFVRMFLDEVRIAAGLSHPNIVRVVDFGVGEGGHYLAMEYLHGRNLRAVQRSVRDGGPLPLAFSVGVIMEIAAGLHAAHEHRDADGNAVEVVHRDVSPSNVMITFDGQVKLLDFGIARVTEQTQLTRAGTLKGKVGYMSPEQCRGERVDRRSDVFGLGILLYELTVGRRAFFAENDYAVIGKVVDGDYARPGRVVAGYPAELEAVIARALEVEPDDRHPTAAALADELARYAAAAGLDVSAAARAAVLSTRFGSEPFPHVNLAVLDAATGRSANPWLRWVALGGVGLVIGGMGFLVGGLVRTEGPPIELAPPVVVGQPPPGAGAGAGGGPAGADAAAPGGEGAAEPLTDDAVEPAGEDEAELVVEDAEPDESSLIDDGTAEPASGSSSRRRRRRRPRDRTNPSGDPDPLLPPTWRDP